jgi:hypothetical protein
LNGPSSLQASAASVLEPAPTRWSWWRPLIVLQIPELVLLPLSAVRVRLADALNCSAIRWARLTQWGRPPFVIVQGSRSLRPWWRRPPLGRLACYASLRSVSRPDGRPLPWWSSGPLSADLWGLCRADLGAQGAFHFEHTRLLPDDRQPADESIGKLIARLKEQTLVYAAGSPHEGDVRACLERLGDAFRMSDYVAGLLPLPMLERQALLDERDGRARLTRVVDLVEALLSVEAPSSTP